MSIDHVAVVGGGITGLAVAFELLRSPSPPHVTLFDSAARLGGKLQASPFAGLPSVDEGADAFLARVPEGMTLCTELGLTDLVSPATGSAFVWHGGRLHPIPDGLVLGVPAGIGGLVRSRLLSARGMVRAGADLVRPRTRPTHDSLGRTIRDRFGREVLERLVDPLVGSINAGDADSLSLAATTPQIAGVANDERSLLLGLRAMRKILPAPAGPVFVAPRSGMAALADALADRVCAGADVRRGTSVQELVRDGRRWRVDGMSVDAVVLTAPAPAAATLLRSSCAEAADALASIPYAGVVMVTMHIDEEVPFEGSGFLVPKPVQHDVTAVSFASRKWAHWQPAGGGGLLRISLGRFGNEAPLTYDDERATHVALDEVGRHLGRSLQPRAVRVGHWPASFPQYLPHHLERVAAIDTMLASDCPGLVVAGAACRGIGVPACIRQGRHAARLVVGR